MAATRVSIRYQLLFFAVVIITVFGFLALSANAAAYRYIDEFQEGLRSHYRMNSFLLELRRQTSTLETLVRGDPAAAAQVDYRNLGQRLTSLLTTFSLNPGHNLEIGFRLRALRNGLGVYLAKAERALDGYVAGSGDYYLDFIMAQRVAWYLERYLSELQNLKLTEGWRYYQDQSVQAEVMRTVLVGALILVLLLSLNFSIHFSRTFTQPIRTLAHLSSRMASGDLEVPDVRIHGHEGDEMGVLARSFNAMSTSIRANVAELRQKVKLEQSLREAQLLNLQAQIKPHFFFNTLNTIVRQAQLEGATKTAHLIRSMASLFRYNLVSHQQAVPLGQELANLEVYLGIQKIRFGTRLDYAIHCEAGAESLLLPPLSLQPFVENAVVHGLETCVNGGRVVLSVRLRGPRVRIRIADNGQGMDKGALTRLGTGGDGTATVPPPAVPQTPQGSGHGLGIRNVLERLRLYHGPDWSLTISSRPGMGCLVRISLPAILPPSAAVPARIPAAVPGRQTQEVPCTAP